MRVTDKRGREVSWSFKGCRVLGDETRPRSSLHLRARTLLPLAFPGEVVFEEVKVPGGRLRLDFVVPARRVAVEVQGEQHFRFNAHFHKSKAEFLASRKRDLEKVEFCQANAIRLVCLPHTESDDEWRARLQG